MDDLGWLGLACDLARLCRPSGTAFSVGAVIVGADGAEIARGFSREDDPLDHAEESALAKVRAAADGAAADGAAADGAAADGAAGARLAGATVYSSLEPCGRRGSRPRGCAELIIAAGAARVVFAWREPSLFVEGTGTGRLLAAGLEVVELPALADRAREPNAHLPGVRAQRPGGRR